MALVGGRGEGLAGPREAGMMLWQHKEGLPNRELEIQKRFQEGNDSKAEAQRIIGS